ncbi:hypothetical protein SOV_17130 [Sporomusa ovata DSM 2662]|uniref:Uncharacterized protein n=1 Tax=Sporomusa ovata TaxID=2378 RepID=A0A0U1KXF3_9FIRM|nr:hypothetical protein [Sporomusa ovata]EQB29313.1 hypothetical protein SOV_1c10460 [Sporomusa ovata DSM 2662]CQR71354.1 hypothetical protein SpAn4DRAFT_3859 [Sporomusa ovata]
MTIDKIRNQRQVRREQLQQQYEAAVTLAILWAGSAYIGAHLLAASWR